MVSMYSSSLGSLNVRPPTRSEETHCVDKQPWPVEQLLDPPAGVNSSFQFVADIIADKNGNLYLLECNPMPRNQFPGPVLQASSGQPTQEDLIFREHWRVGDDHLALTDRYWKEAAGRWGLDSSVAQDSDTQKSPSLLCVKPLNGSDGLLVTFVANTENYETQWKNLSRAYKQILLNIRTVASEGSPQNLCMLKPSTHSNRDSQTEQLNKFGNALSTLMLNYYLNDKFLQSEPHKSFFEKLVEYFSDEYGKLSDRCSEQGIPPYGDDFKTGMALFDTYCFIRIVGPLYIDQPEHALELAEKYFSAEKYQAYTDTALNRQNHNFLFNYCTSDLCVQPYIDGPSTVRLYFSIDIRAGEQAECNLSAIRARPAPFAQSVYQDLQHPTPLTKVPKLASEIQVDYTENRTDEIVKQAIDEEQSNDFLKEKLLPKLLEDIKSQAKKNNIHVYTDHRSSLLNRVNFQPETAALLALGLAATSFMFLRKR